MSITPLNFRPDRTRRQSQRVLDDYTSQSTFSTPGRQAMRLDALPFDPGGVARTVQGLLIYEHVAEPFYWCPIPEGRRAESHLRSVETIIDALMALDRQPLNIARSP